MSDALAGLVRVRRVDDMVALVIEVEAEQLQLIDASEPLVVVAAFEQPADANRVRRALAKAVDDAAAHKGRVKGAGGSQVAGDAQAR